ncbi:CAP domain-containing protein [Xylanimonas allomyrinae]|uniref:CAP domain-containing protein n=1 Tax=Xylanimonas allomyrinae TaxID=2509459 RepID=UPI0013A64C9E|nr:CAP domain-containing protein [Xylanimonas allomyrinae]
MLDLTNARRAQAGCPAVTVDPRLTAAMRLHTQDMAANGYFDHQSLDGRSFADRVRAQGYDSPGGEILYLGPGPAANAVDGWMRSDGHRRIMLDCSLVEVGVGVTDGVWGEVFGRGDG